MRVYLNKADAANSGLSDFVRVFGSEEAMKKFYPKSYQAYKNTLSAEGSMKSGAPDYVDINIAHVAYTDGTRTKVMVEVASDAQNGGGYCILSTQAFNAKTQLPLTSACDDEFVGNMQKTSVIIDTKDVPLNDVIVVANVFAVDDTVASYKLTDSLSSYLLDFTTEFTIERPKKTHTSTSNNDINISYRTMGFSADKLDYYYNSTVMADSQFRIPSKGTIKVRGVNLQKVNSCELTAENASHTKRYHSTQTGAVLQNSTTITWDFPDNWGFKDTEIVAATFEYVVYTLTIKAVAQGKACTFLITNSNESQPANAKHIIEKIYVYRDCFTKGTKITMAAGSQKLIENIKAGDEVLSENRQKATVMEIQCIKQPCSVAHVVTKDGKEIYTTAYHPLVAKTGLRCACLLQAEDVLKTADGESVVEQVCVSPEEQTEVYILTLNDSGKRLYANGFLTGDSETELTEEDKATNLRHRVGMEWLGDYDSWTKRDNGLALSPRGAVTANPQSVCDIDEVQVEETGDAFTYCIYTNDSCSGKIKAILSEYNSTDPSGRLEAESAWYGFYGTAAVKKSVLAGKSDLYAYLLDEDTGVTSSVIKVYYEPCALEKWELDNSLVLFPHRGVSAYQFSDELLIAYTDSHSMFTAQRLTLPNTRIALEQLELSPDSRSFTFELQYHMISGGANVYSAMSPKTTVYIKPPEVSGISVSQDKISVSGQFIEGLTVGYDVMLGDVAVSNGTLSDSRELTLDSGIIPDDTCGYSVRFYYRTDTGGSLKTGRFPIIARLPVVTACEYEGDNAVITLAENGVYSIAYNSATVKETGNRFSVPKLTEKVSIRAIIGGTSQGRAIEYMPSCHAYYPLTVGNGTFYSLQDNPDKLKADADITFAVEAPVTEPYGGTYFNVAVSGGAATMTIKKTIYTAAASAVRDDFKTMLKKYAADNGAVNALRNAVKSKMPMQAGELLFYHYDCSMSDGYTGVVDGMSLLTEYAVYQNIPGESGSGLSGFAGTGTARYGVIARDKKLKVDSFASGMNFTVEPPAPLKTDNKLCGGAGVADLLYTGFSAANLRIVYPVKFTGRNSPGDLVYSNNICLLASDSIEPLDAATVNMRRGALSVAGVAYHYFRGRSVVIPQIRIDVNGTSEWVSLGTTLRDVLGMRGAGHAVLKRRLETGLHTVYCADADMPLLIGDTIIY